MKSTDLFKVLTESFNDNYEKDIESLVLEWFNDNVYEIQSEVKVDVDTRRNEEEPIAYKITLTGENLDKYIEDIAEFVVDNIPSLEYVKCKNNGEQYNLFFRCSTDEKFESQMLGEGYSLGDDEDSFDIWDKNSIKLYQIAGFLLKNGVEVVRDLSTIDKGVALELSQDSIYKLVIHLKGYNGDLIGKHLHADGEGKDYVIMDIDDALASKQAILDELMEESEF